MDMSPSAELPFSPSQKLQAELEARGLGGPRGHIRIRLWEICQVRDVMVKRGPYFGQPSLYRLSRGTGISYSTILSLVKDPAGSKSITMDVMLRLCEFLQCTPGDLLEYRPEPPVRPQKRLPAGQRKVQRPWRHGAVGTRASTPYQKRTGRPKDGLLTVETPEDPPTAPLSLRADLLDLDLEPDQSTPTPKIESHW